MSLLEAVNNNNNFQEPHIPHRETEIIYISDDLLLNCNEINYNDNNKFIIVHYNQSEE